MGSPEAEQGRQIDEGQHHVTLTNPYYIGVCPVTQGQWLRLMDYNPSVFIGQDPDLPVDSVSWEAAAAYIDAINRTKKNAAFRLPTEAEWEYACRAGTTTARHWGDAPDCSKANYGNSARSAECRSENPGRPSPVGSYPASPWGVYDTIGNLWEWCHDWYGEYLTGTTEDPVGPPEGTTKVVRGGCWLGGAAYCRSAARNHLAPDITDIVIGFRVVFAPF